MELISLLNKVFGIVIPILDEHEAQLYTHEENERNLDWAKITSTKDDPMRRLLIAGFIKQLCNDAGNPVGRLSGTSIEVPVEYFDSLVRNSTRLIRTSKESNLFMQTIRRQSK